MVLLTADDVLNKKFQPTKFREGYDQDEVDDFLDEVVNTLRSVGGENEALKAKLEAAERRIAELSGGAEFSPAVAESGEAPAEQTTQFAAFGEAAAPAPAVAEVPATESAGAPVESVVAAPAAQPAPSADFMAASGGDAKPGTEPESATGMLALAQRLHDEYVHNGKAEAERLVTEARTEGDRLTREADEQRTRTLSQLESERSLLERKIDELRVFERDYRTRLKSYLEGLLTDVEGRGSISAQYTSGEQHDSRRL